MGQPLQRKSLLVCADHRHHPPGNCPDPGPIDRLVHGAAWHQSQISRIGGTLILGELIFSEMIFGELVCWRTDNGGTKWIGCMC
ncbi:hypothetical protein SBA1_1350006 [Candidatus Sulfotelmatobacter kueseliae]|uniref:Uncharacterized protein n=1 Tax=Candidatus Sulfotelmatobacter kueseliae TaxID=2042962 RepID=A0A2U3K5N2_9BACT|nr:hypothetical protein SBA1_1350006 [Candidatus Sulfotelmatobacter kueseliae]